MRRLRDELQPLALLPSPLPGLRSRLSLAEEAAMITFTIDLWFLTFLLGLFLGCFYGYWRGSR